MTEIEQFRALREELREFIADRADLARYLVDNAPASYRIVTSSNKAWAGGWETGFGRCLAELKRISEQMETNR